MKAGETERVIEANKALVQLFEFWVFKSNAQSGKKMGELDRPWTINLILEVTQTAFRDLGASVSQDWQKDNEGNIS